MKSIVYYFTGNGNSLAAAEVRLAEIAGIIRRTNATSLFFLRVSTLVQRIIYPLFTKNVPRVDMITGTLGRGQYHHPDIKVSGMVARRGDRS